MKERSRFCLTAVLLATVIAGCGSGGGSGTNGGNTTPDISAPSVPTGLVTAATSASVIALSWLASTDNLAVAGYTIYRAGSKIATATTMAYTDTGLLASTTYSYSVSAYDAAGNESARSISASGTTLDTSPTGDTTAPSVPANLIATPVSTTQVSLSWTASTDNLAVTGYKIYKAGGYLKTVGTTTTSDTSLAASTHYCYTVSAVDAANNESAQSTQACATTSAPTTDTTAPTISSTTPALGASNIAVNETISAIFSEAMNAATITTSTFTLKGSDNSTTTRGTISYAGTTATFKPEHALAYGMTYTATISTAVKDEAGNNIANQYTWSFTTTPPPLDLSFGVNGVATTSISTSGNNIAYSLLLQSDGRIVAAGSAYPYGDFAVARYNMNGTLDTTFGAGGTSVISTIYGDDARSMALQSDEKIIVFGDYYNTVTRINTDGLRDNSFGGAGSVHFQIGSNSSYDRAHSVKVQTDGKIVTIGSAYTISNSDFAVARLTTTGTLDSSFGSGGKATTPIGSFDDVAYDAAIQADGKIVVAGYASDGSLMHFALARYNSNGTMDASFGSGGKVISELSDSLFDDVAQAMALQLDGKIVLAGWGAYHKFVLARFNADGSIDTSFNGGRVITQINNSDNAYGVAICPNNKIVAAGSTMSNERPFLDIAVVRYNADGSLDSSFGSNGIVTTRASPYDNAAYSVVCQPDNKVLVSGYAYNGTLKEFVVLRYK